MESFMQAFADEYSATLADLQRSLDETEILLSELAAELDILDAAV